MPQRLCALRFVVLFLGPSSLLSRCKMGGKEMRNWGRTFVFWSSFCLCRSHPFAAGCRSAGGTRDVVHLWQQRHHLKLALIFHFAFVAVPKEKTQDGSNLLYIYVGTSIFTVLTVIMWASLFLYRRRKQAHFNEIPTVSIFLKSIREFCS